MRSVRVVGCFIGLSVALVACVGGPGQLPDQGADQASQGGGIQGDPSGSGSSSASNGNSGSGGSVGGGATPATPPTKTEPSLPTTIFVKDYNLSCKTDTDCVLVFQGAVCTPCQCENAAIARTDRSKYRSDLSDRSESCPDPGDIACAPCASATAGCDPNTKQCAVGVSSVDAGN